MTEITTCSTSNCDNPATVKAADTSVPMLVCGACWHAMMMVETETTMGEADRAAARQLVKDWCDPRVPKGWEMREPGLIVRVGEAHGSFEYWVDVRDRYFRSHANTGRVPVEIVDIALRSIIAGMAPALAGTLTSALDDGDCLRGVIARAIRASDSIADNDAEDVIQEMLAILLEAEPEGRDDTVEWARMEGANAMLELIVAAGYGARGISDNREGLRKAVAELAVAATMPRKPEPEFEGALLQREVEQLRAQLAGQQQAAHERANRQAEEWRQEVDKALLGVMLTVAQIVGADGDDDPLELLHARMNELAAFETDAAQLRVERDQARSLASEFRTRAKVEAQDVRREGATWEKYVAWVNAGTTGMHGELRWGIAEDVPTAENVDQYIADDIRWMVEDADAGCSGWDLLAEIAAMVIE